jgi:dTDP-4-dehydrorhamnose reductase
MSRENSRPKILLTGKTGQVGRELAGLLDRVGEVTAVDRQQLDLTKPDEIRQVVRGVGPSLIVNAAAYTAVDRAESEEAVAQAINAVAPGVLAEEAKKLGALLVHYSTDYVFDGTKGQEQARELILPHLQCIKDDCPQLRFWEPIGRSLNLFFNEED